MLALALPLCAQAAPLKGRAVTSFAALASQPACPDADLAPSRENLDRVEDATLCLLNLERSRRGRRPLATNPRLERAALGHTRDMVEHSYFDHDGRDGSQFGDRIRATGYLDGAGNWMIGENLAWGTGELATPDRIVRAWMASPGHKDNILEPGYREIGLGVLAGNPRRPDGRGATYATEFGMVKRARRAR